MARETRKDPKTEKSGKRIMKEFSERKRPGRPRKRASHERQEGYDWKKYPKKGWPYEGLDDPNYIRERDTLILEHGNGWWRLVGTPQFLEFRKERKLWLENKALH